MRKGTEISIIAGGAFAAGVLAGLLLDPKVKNEIASAVKANSGRAEDWLKGRKQIALLRIERGIREIKEMLDKNLADPVPNLYKATEEFSLEEDDLPNR